MAVFDRSVDWAKTLLLGDVTGSAALSADNESLAIVSEQLGLIRIWSVSAKRDVAVLADANVTGDTQVVFSGDGKRLVAGGPRNVRIWNLAGEGEKLTPSGHTGGVSGLAFSPDGTLLASAGKDHTVKLWNPLTGDLIHTLDDFHGPAQTAAFSPDGRMLVTGDWSGAVQFWDTQSHQQLAQVNDHQVGPQIWSVAFSPNGEYFAASGEKGATVWRLQVDPDKENLGVRLIPQQPALLTTGYVDFAVFSPDSKRYAWAEQGQPRTAHVWDLDGARELVAPPLEVRGEVYGVAFYPNSRLMTFVSSEGAVEVWDVTTRKRTLSYAGPEHTSNDGAGLHGHIALSGDGRWVALDVVADSGQALTIWDREGQQMLLRLPEESGAIWAVALGPDRNLLAVATSTGGPVIWNIRKIRSQLAELELDW